MSKHRLLPLLTVTLFSVSITSCTESGDPPLFEELSPKETKVTFENQLRSDSEFNVYKYRNFYNGGGVAVADVNQDSLPDIYLTANRGENRLYLNQGSFSFMDVTKQAGVAGSKPWTTGASFVDINDDGLLDIYVTNSGEFDIDKRRNELFINNGDGSFTESANDYGLDDPGYSIHAAFFDYDLDGDLDMYLLNNSDASIVDFDLDKEYRSIRDEMGGDKLYRNDGGFFSDVSEKAGIYSPEIGFSLSAAISDLNRDGYPDIYVANDFFEYDYLYMNNGDGTFDEVLKEQINSISAASMGSDIADINNDGWPDIYVTDMLPLTDERTKQITTFENWERFSMKKSQGYHYQVTRNTLQLNNANGTYSEVGRLAGIQASDWSWATLIADFDLNGYSDILITNGLIQDITNLDYIEEINRPDMVRSIIQDENVNFDQLIDMIPSTPIPNVVYANEGGLVFTERAKEWGLGEPGYSSGASWADFDNDGDLDLVVNNVNKHAKIFKNRSVEYLNNQWLHVDLKGESPNRYAIGASVEVWADRSYWYREHFLQRGYQSSVDPGMFFGLANHDTIDSLKVNWPDGRISVLKNVESSQSITVHQSKASLPDTTNDYSEPALIAGDISPDKHLDAPLFSDITDDVGLEWTHEENEYIDFNRESLLLHMRSTEGPALCTADINGDGLDEIYIGGAREQPGILIFQNQNGEFVIKNSPVFEKDALSEDTDCAFFDADGDGDYDLYVTSGGNSFSTGSSALFDRLYLNDGSGNFQKQESFIPPGGYSTNSTVSAADFNSDGSIDLFVGERLKPFSLGTPVRGFLLINDGNGHFTEQSAEWNENFEELGMITDSAILDWDGDGLIDLAIAGEWMPIRIFKNTGNSFEEMTNELNLTETKGLWNSLHADDFDGDGRDDLIAGNHGLNTHFKTSNENPLRMWVGDFENDGMPEQIISRSFDGRDKPFVLKHDLLNQIPSLREKYPDYSDYADQSMQDIFSSDLLESAMVLETDMLESVLFMNRISKVDIIKLPLRSQFSPLFGIWTGQLFDREGKYLVTVGNLYEVKPMAGQYDASYGSVVTSNLQSIPQTISGFSVEGSGRKIASIKNANNDKILIIARNNATPLFFKIN